MKIDEIKKICEKLDQKDQLELAHWILDNSLVTLEAKDQEIAALENEIKELEIDQSKLSKLNDKLLERVDALKNTLPAEALVNSIGKSAGKAKSRIQKLIN